MLFDRPRIPFIQRMGILLIMTLAGCDSRSPDVPFEIIDSGMIANSAGSGHVVWLDNETIVFTRRLPPDYPPPHTRYPINFSLWAWNVKSNQLDLLSDDSSDRYCMEDGLLYYNHENRQFTAKPVKHEGRYILENISPIPANHHIRTRGDAHCSVIDNANPPPMELFADLRAFDAKIIKRWHPDVPENKRLHSGKFDHIFISDQFPEGKHLSELKRGRVMRYFAHSNQYLINRIAPHSPRGVARNKAIFEYWLLSEDGSMEQILVPPPWPFAVEAYMSAAGLIIASDNLAKDPKLSEQGVWLFNENGSQITELAAGYSKMEALSPDGCKLAFSHEPKILPFGKGNSSLKVIDLCL